MEHKKIVGIMMTKNEGDFIKEVLDSWHRHNIQIIAMDDSDDGTFEIMQQYDNVIAFKQSELYPTNIKGSGDWMFQGLLDKKRELFGIDNYVCIALGDEIWFSDPKEVVAAMEAEHATFAEMESYQFYLHPQLKLTFPFEIGHWTDKLTTVQRLSHYADGWFEQRVFFDSGQHNYAPNQGFNTIPDGVKSKKLSKHFYYGHYPLRSPHQILDRAKDRVERDYQPFYNHSYKKELEDVFYENFPGSAPEDNHILPFTIYLITPVSRMENMQALHDSIKRQKLNYMRVHWHFIGDGTKVSPEELSSFLNKLEVSGSMSYIVDEESVSGNSQRNCGIHCAKDGISNDWVYFLDDDNILPDGFLERVEQLILKNPKATGFVWNQIHPNGQIRLLADRDKIKVCHIDTAQYILRSDIINIYWPKEHYTADGFFIETIGNEHKQNFVIVNENLCYYNYLRP